MGKYALIGRVGADDNGIQLTNAQYAGVGTLDILRNGADDMSLNNFLKALKQLRLIPSEIAMDLLVISCMMYAADTRINRKELGEDSWTRLIDLYIPVTNPNLWESQADQLQKIFRFLTGDIWTIYFRSRHKNHMTIAPEASRLRRFQMPYQTDTVCLFSGGMDSFIGVIDLLRQGVRPLLVGHSKSSDVTPFQTECFDAINNAYPQQVLSRIYSFIRIPKNNLFDSEDHNERGRSFLFLSLGLIAASCLGRGSRLVVPENGMISLNIPLTPLRIGSHSTRTTHPYYMEMMRQFSRDIGLGVAIENPYQFKTKGEMLRECSNIPLVQNTNTMSCSHPSGRFAGRGNGHCGYCVPCIIRQSAYLAANVPDHSIYRTPVIDQIVAVSRAEGADILAFKYMIEKINQNPNYLTASIRSTGPLGTNINPYLDIYIRGLREVEHLVSQIQLR